MLKNERYSTSSGEENFAQNLQMTYNVIVLMKTYSFNQVESFYCLTT